MNGSPPARRQMTLLDALAEFRRYPSPWLLGVALLAAVIARAVAGDWRITDAMVPIVMAAAFPFFEWMIHVVVLHWRPRSVAGLTVDPLLARKHRDHHIDPRAVGLVFIPLQSLVGALVSSVAIAVWIFPRTGLGLSFLVVILAFGLVYEWTPLPGPHRLQAETSALPRDLAQSPAAPLQERALLVRRDDSGHRGSGVANLPGSGVGRDITDGEEPACHGRHRQKRCPREQLGVDDDRVADVDLVVVPRRVVGTEVDAAVADVGVAL